MQKLRVLQRTRTDNSSGHLARKCRCGPILSDRCTELEQIGVPLGQIDRWAGRRLLVGWGLIALFDDSAGHHDQRFKLANLTVAAAATRLTTLCDKR